jgi:RNA polymerase subunit RPABC4/transcription elongation factor Spt4
MGFEAVIYRMAFWNCTSCGKLIVRIARDKDGRCPVCNEKDAPLTPIDEWSAFVKASAEDYAEKMGVRKKEPLS